MNLQKTCLAILFCALALTVCYGQNEPEYVEGENWVTQYGLYPAVPYVLFRYDRYSREDTVRFREKLDALKTAKFTDEWEGNYVRDNEDLGYSSLRFQKDAGFINFYFYSCSIELRHIDYGKISSTPDFIELTSEGAENSPRKIKTVRFVKVKWDKWRYLVEESSLQSFAEKAVGIYVEPDDETAENNSRWTNYWVKDESRPESETEEYKEKTFTGLPEFPAAYKKFQRQPIETKIVAVGKATLEKDKEFGDSTYTKYFADSLIYPVTIGAGENKGVKPGMRFELAETGDEIYITEVKQNTAFGFIPRSTDENQKEVCRDKEYNDVLCPKIKPDFKATTPIGKFWFF